MSQHAIDNAAAWWQEIKEMVATLDRNEWHKCSLCDNPEKCRDQAMCDLGEVGEDEEAAQRRIHESALSVEVRDGWRTPGAEIVGNPAEEYAILLTTGGPALRLYGRLGRYGPDGCPTLQWQDWGTPWTDWQPEPWDETYRETLQTFASQFYFGD